MTKEKLQWVYGRKPIREALQAGESVDRIYALASLKKEGLPELRALAKSHGVPIHWVPAERLNRLVKGNHQGVAAQVSLIRYYDIQDVIAQTFEKGEVPLILLLDHITDVRNLGAIARTAYGAGAHAIVVPAKGTASINEDAIKTSAGALHHLSVCRHHSLVELIQQLQQYGIAVYALAGEAPLPMSAVDAKGPCAFILGAEETGVSTPLRFACDEEIALPMQRPFDSYNVSVAAGMVLYEVMRQRQ
mgnify:FL=1